MTRRHLGGADRPGGEPDCNEGVLSGDGTGTGAGTGGGWSTAAGALTHEARMCPARTGAPYAQDASAAAPTPSVAPSTPRHQPETTSAAHDCTHGRSPAALN